MPDPLTQTAVKKHVVAGIPGEYRDARSRGLLLRVAGPDNASWNVRRSFKGRDYRLDFGGEWTLDEARGIAAEVEAKLESDKRLKHHSPWFAFPGEWDKFVEQRRRLRAGEAPLVGEYDKMRQRAEVLDAAHAARERERKSPAWDEAIKLWAAELERTKRPTTAYNYRLALNVAEMQRFGDRSVATISRVEVAEAIAEIHARGKENQALKTAISVRLMFEFLGTDAMTRKSLVEPERMKLLRAPAQTLVEDKEHDGNGLLVPDGPMVGHLVRQFRDEGSRVSERNRLLGLLAVYTVQRRRSVALATKEDFVKAERGGVWSMRPSHRKNASAKRRRGINVGDHVICLPPQAWAVVERAIELSGDSDFLFPAQRRRWADVEPTTINPRTVSGMFAGLPGNPVKIHDLRRAFGTTFANEADLDDLEVKVVLDHSEGIKSGDVTRAHYRLTTGQDKKWAIYEAWVAWVDKWAATPD